MRRWLLIFGGLAAVTAAVLVARFIIGEFAQRHQIATACEVTGTSYTFSTDQARYAAAISAVAINRELPERAVVVALATALQESHLENVSYGDRDSVGLFQQRPSQGWGTSTQLLDPQYAAGKFYDALLKIPNWQNLPLTDVAQSVQRSAFPSGYSRWEERATALAAALTGVKEAGLSCTFPAPHSDQKSSSADDSSQISKIVTAVQSELHNVRQVSDDRTHVEFIPANWVTATWLVANSQHLHIKAVTLNNKKWTHDKGWQSVSDSIPSQIKVEMIV